MVGISNVGEGLDVIGLAIGGLVGLAVGDVGLKKRILLVLILIPGTK